MQSATAVLPEAAHLGSGRPFFLLLSRLRIEAGSAFYLPRPIILTIINQPTRKVAVRRRLPSSSSSSAGSQGARQTTLTKGPLFRTVGRGTGWLTATPLPQANAHAMVRRRAAAVGIETLIGNHTFRATGITAYLGNGGTLERAAAMAGHASTRTTQLYDRRHDAVTLDEVERVLI